MKTADRKEVKVEWKAVMVRAEVLITYVRCYRYFVFQQPDQRFL